MFVKVPSVALKGVDTIKIDIEVSMLNRGLPSFDIVGLPNKSVAESRNRIRMSFNHLGLDFPSRKKILVNLAPADLHKEGSFYDLPIAMGILCNQYALSLPKDSLFFGELSLNGDLRYTYGSFLLGLYAKEHGFKSIFIPKQCMSDLQGLTDIEVYGMGNIIQIHEHLTGTNKLTSRVVTASSVNDYPCNKSENAFGREIFDSILGQHIAKRALMISAAGAHSLCMIGPPGVGKTLLAKASKYLLPALSRRESMEVAKIYSAIGIIGSSQDIYGQRPFRSPHSSITKVGILGGGTPIKPGEMSLAHKGILFMDEFCEFSRDVIESMRQPLETKKIILNRNSYTYEFPCDTSLIIATNPCPCGYRGHPTIPCKCSKPVIDRYMKKLSGPLMDRIDLQIRLSPVKEKYYDNKDLANEGITYDNAVEMIYKARLLQRERYVGEDFNVNSEIPYTKYSTYLKLTAGARSLLASARSTLFLSTRAYYKVITVARTIADLAGSDIIAESHISESLSYRIKMG